MITKTIALCLCVLGLAAPAALAQVPSENGYGETHVLPQTPKSQPSVAQPSVPQSGVAGSKVGNAAPPRSVNVAAGHGSGLPFTGLDVGAVVLAALILLAVGVGLRRATTTRSTP